MGLTIQQLLQQYGPDYAKRHQLTIQQQKVLRHLCDCRTEANGFHHDICDSCGYEQLVYHSCKDRHCPQCQTFAKEKWVNQRQSVVIQSHYFHVVVTLPKVLHTLARHNQRLVYTTLFKAANVALSTLTANEKYLGAQSGFLAVLHTWGQTLNYHPHLHLIVTGGGLTPSHQWKQTPIDFFIPVKKLSATFRYFFLQQLKHAYTEKQLCFYGKMTRYEDPLVFQQWIDSLYREAWYSYVKQPFPMC